MSGKQETRRQGTVNEEQLRKRRSSFLNPHSSKKRHLAIFASGAVLTVAALLLFSYYYAFATVTSAVWDDADNGDRVLSNGDTLTITFSAATDQPGGTGVQTKSQVDSMIDFENSLGANYTGQWTAADTFVITIVDATGGTAQVGDDVFRQSESLRIFALDTTGGTAFAGPFGVATNSTDFIFVTDFVNNNVQIFNPDGTFADSLDTTGGTAFGDPRGVATNSTDFIFVTDSANANAQIFHPNGTTTGVNLDTTGGTAFGDPNGVATNSTDFIFVTDFANNNVQIFRPDGTFADTVDTTGGTAFSDPQGVATNSTDFIFVADSANANAQIFHPNGTFAAAQPTTGGTAFANPRFITIDNDDRLIVPDINTDLVQVFGPASIQNAAQTSLLFTNTFATTGDFGLATILTGVVADDPDNGDAVLSAGDTLVFTFNNPTNVAAGGTMTLAEINGNFTFGGGAKTIGTVASGLWDSATQLTITINSADGTIVVGDAVGVAGGATIADDITETVTFTSTASITGDFGVIPVSSGGGGGGGDSSPPSFTTGFSEGEPVLQINGDSFAADDLGGTQNTIVAHQGQPVSFQVMLFDNEGPDNIRHVDLFLDKQGQTILNDLTETYITYDNGEITVHDPNGIIESAQITKTQEGNKTVFTFDIVFSGEVENSDIVVQAWDIRRNVVYLHANDILEIMPSEQAAEPVETQQVQEQQTQEPTMPEQPVQTTEDLTEQDQTIRQWAGYDTESATDGQLLEAVIGKEATDGQTAQIPSWVKGDVAEWYVSGQITYGEFAAVINYLYDYGLLISEESEDET